MLSSTPGYVKVMIDFERFEDGWMFPKISIEGADSYEDYERISAAYELLGALLLRLARHRKLPSARTRARLQHDAERAADHLLRARWIQLTLEEEL